MSKAKELLLECKVKLSVKTDYKLAQALKIPRMRIGDYMRGERVPDTYACVRIALALKRDPAVIEAETENNPERKVFWADFLQRVKEAGRFGMLAVLFTTSLFAGQPTASGGGFRWCVIFA